MIVGDIVDTYEGTGGRQGKPPEADPAREYIAGGGSNFPLLTQQVLTHSVDDLASDLGPQVYEVMLNDSTVSSAVAILITGALSGEFQLVSRVRAEDREVVEPGSDRAAAIELSQYYRDFCQRNIDRLDTPIKLICHELLYAMVYGCKLAEVTYEMGEGEDAGKLVVKVIRTKRNRAWNYVVEPTGDVVAIRALTYDSGLSDLPPAKFLIVRWMPRDGDPRGRSILRPAYNGWNLKVNLWPKYFKYLEKFGCPTVVGMTAPDAPQEPELTDAGTPTGRWLTAEEAMAQMLARLDGGSYAAIANGASIHPIQPNNNGNAFLQAFNLFKTEILEGIIINARGVIAAVHSSKADNDSAKDTVGQITLYAREILEDAFRDQLFWHLIYLNGGKEHADLYTPHVSLGEAEHQDIAALATAYNLIGYQADPIQFPAIDAKLGLPVRTVEETDAPLPDEVDGDPANFAADEGPDLETAAAKIGDLLADDPDPVAELAETFADLPDPEWEAEARDAWDSLLRDQAEADDDPADERSRRADLIATMVLVLLDLHADELAASDAVFNCGTGAGGFKEGNTCQPHGGGGGGSKGSRGSRASKTTVGGTAAKVDAGALTTRQAAALKGWATRKAKAEAAKASGGGVAGGAGGAGGGKATPAVKPPPAGTKPTPEPGLTPRQIAARKGAETRRANQAARDLAAKDKASGESKAKAKADAATARSKAKADATAAKAKAKADAAASKARAKADADAAKARAKADAAKAKADATKAKAKSEATAKSTVPGTGKPVLPGRPIAERIKADAEGDALVAAITKAGTSRAVARSEELRAELKEIGVVSSGPKLARLATIYQELEGVSKTANADRQAINRQAHDLLATTHGLKLTTLDTDHTGSEPLTKLSATERKAHDEATAFVAKVFARTPADDELRVWVGTLGADATSRSHVAKKSILAMDPHEPPDVHVHELGHVLEFQTPGVSARVQEFLAHRVGSESLVKLNAVIPGSNYDPDEMGRKDKFDSAFSTHEAYYIGKHYDGGTEVLSMGLQKVYNDPVGFASKDPEYFKFVTGILSGRLR